jgi:hypothetical protein
MYAHGDLVAEPKYKAVLHVVPEGFLPDGTQRCVMCGARVLNHRTALVGTQGGRIVGDVVVHGFPMGPVTTIFPPEPDRPPITVIGAVPHARPCTIPESEWRDA